MVVIEGMLVVVVLIWFDVGGFVVLVGSVCLLGMFKCSWVL